LEATAMEAFSFVFGQDLEQQLGAAAVQMEIAELVQAEQVVAAVAGHGAAEVAFAGGLDQLVDECGGGGIADPTAGLAGGHTQADQQVALAGARVT
jgi:hypothetical protein